MTGFLDYSPKYVVHGYRLFVVHLQQGHMPLFIGFPVHFCFSVKVRFWM